MLYDLTSLMDLGRRGWISNLFSFLSLLGGRFLAFNVPDRKLTFYRWMLMWIQSALTVQEVYIAPRSARGSELSSFLSEGSIEVEVLRMYVQSSRLPSGLV